MSVSARIISKLTVVETLEGAFVDPGNATFGINGLDLDVTLGGATTPPATKVAAFELALVAGAATINLAALPGKTSEETINGTGLKVQAIKLRGKPGNANPITATKGASSGYGLNAAGASWTAVLDADAEVLFRMPDTAPDIASGARTIDVTGTGTQVLQVEIVMG